MAETDNRGYPYPPGGVEPNVPYWLGELAEAVDADVAALTADTGWIDLQLAPPFVTSGFGARYRRKAGVVFLQAVTDPAAFGASATLATLPEGFRPVYLWSVQSTHSTGPREVLVNPDGVISVAPAIESNAGIGINISTSFPTD